MALVLAGVFPLRDVVILSCKPKYLLHKCKMYGGRIQTRYMYNYLYIYIYTHTRIYRYVCMHTYTYIFIQ